MMRLVPSVAARGQLAVHCRVQHCPELLVVQYGERPLVDPLRVIGSVGQDEQRDEGRYELHVDVPSRVGW